MSASAGYLATVKLSGTSTSFTGAACTDLGSDVFQITDTAKQILDPDAAITVYDDAVEVDATTYTVDFLFGKITFDSSPGGAVTVDASYLPLLSVGMARGVTISMVREELGDSLLGNAYTSFIVGHNSASGEIDQLELFDVDMDSGGGTVTWKALHENDTAKLLEVDLGANYFRSWCKFPGLNADAPGDGIVSGKVAWKSVQKTATGRTEQVSFGTGT